MKRLIDWGFTHVGEWDAQCRFIPSTDADAQVLLSSTAPATYVWLATGDDRPRYVGLAGKGVTKRMEGHRAGFTGSLRGRRHAADIVSETDGVTVWARAADPVEIFGVAVPGHATEEHALIEALRPKWNKGADDDKAYAEWLTARDDLLEQAT